MPDPRLRRVARVAVTTADEAYVGSGFAIEGRYVLTCAHLLEDAAEINVSFLETGNGKSFKANVAWNGSEVGLDAALLVLRTLPKAFTPFAIHHGVFGEGTKWMAYGFPLAGRGGSSDEPVPLFGEAWTVTGDHLHLADQAPPDDDMLSQGASGAAVLVSGSVCGVIRKKPQQFEGRRVHATAMSALLEHDRFRELLGIGRFFDGSPRELHELMRRHVVDLLAKSPAAVSKLWELEPLASAAVDRQTAGALADQLLTSQLSTVLRVLVTARSQLIGRRAVQRNPAAARALAELMTWATPALVPPEVVAHAKAWKPGLSSLPIPYGTATMAEVLMAALEGRACAFTDTSTAADAPGEACVYYPGKVQVSLTGDPFMATFQQSLLQHLRLSGVPKDLWDQRINARLEDRRNDDEEASYYMIVLPADGQRDRELHETRLAEIAKRYDHLVILSPDLSRYQEECRDMLEPILKLRKGG